MQPTILDRRMTAVVLLAVGLRFALALAVWQGPGRRAVHTPDTESYRLPAKQLLQHGTFTVGGRPEVIRTPGYPWLLTLGLAAKNLERVTVAVQIGLAAVTVFLTGCLAAMLCVPSSGVVSAGPHEHPAGRFPVQVAAVLAAALLAVEPLSLLYTVKLTTETLFTALYLSSLVALAWHLRRPGTLPLVASAVLLTAAVYVRPIAYFLPIVNALVILVVMGRRGNQGPTEESRRGGPSRAVSIAHAASYLAICLGLIGLWHVRNVRVAGYYPFSAIGAINRYYYTAAGVWAKQHGESYYDVQDRWGYHDQDRYFQEHPEQRDWNESQRLNWMRAESYRLIAEHPATAARLHLRGMGLAMFEPASVEWLRLFGRYPQEGRLLGRMFDDGLAATLLKLRREQPLVFWSCVVGGGLLAALYALGTIGWLRLPSPRDPVLVLALLHAAYFLTASGGPQAVGRFRHPIMPLVCALAGIGAAAILDQRRLARAGAGKERPSNE